ncbi:MAG: putative basic amino acid antiporter YfcC [Candidatus Aminicenantes bacterium]|nr:putative basic amino acid antiporter YfcC [Candidatus Aminicenantes bacterium]
MKLGAPRLPHTLVLIYAMVVLTVIATWLVPGGEYQRVEKDGRLVPVDGTFMFTAREPQGLGALFISPLKGFVEAAAIIAFVFIMGGVFAVVEKTGAVNAGIRRLAAKFGTSGALRTLLIPVTMVVFSLGGAVFGMCEETMPFILVFVPLALSLGYDTIVGVAIPFVGAASGFAGAFFNPFTVGIAQGIAGLPLYSGLGYRLVVWTVGTAMAVSVVMLYAARVKKNPRISPTYEEDRERRREFALDAPPAESVRMSARHKAVLILFLLGLVGLVVGILKYKWYIEEIAGLFLALGLAAGVIGRVKGDDIARAFVAGAKDMVNTALIIGCARALLVVAMDGKILDTTLYAMSRLIAGVHPVFSAQLMFLSQGVINFFVHSGTAQAALTMPIMAPLGDLVGITRQTSVFAFQLCEYINPILPTSGVTMGVLGLAKLRWDKWAKWFLPLMILWIVFSLLALIPPVLTRWK